jgi:hypothetical protein
MCRNFPPAAAHFRVISVEYVREEEELACNK